MRASHVLEQHREALHEIAQRYAGKGLTNLRVFGSVARGTDTGKSDIDFLVDADKSVSLLTIGALYSELEDLLGMKIDLVLSEEIPNFFMERILNEAKPVCPCN